MYCWSRRFFLLAAIASVLFFLLLTSRSPLHNSELTGDSCAVGKQFVPSILFLLKLLLYIRFFLISLILLHSFRLCLAQHKSVYVCEWTDGQLVRLMYTNMLRLYTSYISSNNNNTNTTNKNYNTTPSVMIKLLMTKALLLRPFAHVPALSLSKRCICRRREKRTLLKSLTHVHRVKVTQFCVRFISIDFFARFCVGPRFSHINVRTLGPQKWELPYENLKSLYDTIVHKGIMDSVRWNP